MYRDLHMCIILNNVLKVILVCIDVHNTEKLQLLLILQRIPIVENVFFFFNEQLLVRQL
jgi:hypothetical protein